MPAFTSSKYLVVFDSVYPIHPVVFPLFFFRSTSIPYESPLPKAKEPSLLELVLSSGKTPSLYSS